MKAIYIVTLEGSEVFHNQSFEGCIESFRDLPIIRKRIKEEHNLEFENLSAKTAIIGNMTTLLIIEILNLWFTKPN